MTCQHAKFYVILISVEGIQTSKVRIYLWLEFTFFFFHNRGILYASRWMFSSVGRAHP